MPTGIPAVAQEERSQHLNLKLAMSRLNELLRQKENEPISDCRNSRWNHHNSLERGNPVRVFEGEDFRLKKVEHGSKGTSMPPLALSRSEGFETASNQAGKDRKENGSE
jgi:protein subunit release factor B